MNLTSESTFQDINWDNWQAQNIATLTFVIENSQVLLIRKKRGLGQGKINGPGGRLKKGETLPECAVREVQEELKITPRKVRCHGELLFQFIDGYSLHVYVYSSHQYSGTPQETDEAVPMWYPLDAIPFDEMWADDRLWIPLMLKGQSFKGCFLFDDDTMVGHSITEL